MAPTTARPTENHVPKTPAAKKPRVYEVAKDLGMSSEAVLQIARGLGVELKNHMSTLTPDTVEKIQAQIARGTAAVKEELARKHEHELQRAREERARQAAAAAAAAAAAPRTPTPTTTPAAGGGGPRPGGFGGGSGLARPAAPRGLRRRDRKKKKAVDEKLAMESVRKTLASLDAGGIRRRHRRREDGDGELAVDEAKVIRATEFITVAELANLMEVRPQEAIAACMRLGLMATINKRLDKDTIVAVADEFGFEVEFQSEYAAEEEEEAAAESVERMLPRAPVVTVMGHVDHGKTSLLDHIRKTNVIAGESGGITQHIGAYDVELPGGRKICFLDTPGHEAFTAMRARGAQVTDIVVLVVAADDRVMPQTIEAIDHAKAAGVPIVVAINKIDLPTAQPDRVKQELASHGVVVEEYGGKTVCVEISAKKGTNTERLLEMILLVAELLDLKADPVRRAKGVVLEARVEQGRGVVASLLVQNGTLRVGDAFVAGHHSGRVRAMFDERVRPVKDAGPSTPVEVLGWSGTPAAGDLFTAFAEEREAREVAYKRQAVHREHEFRAAKSISLTEIYSQISQGEVSELKMIIKGDVDGSVEALSESLTKLSTGEVAVRVIRQAVGQISESDVLLAAASGAIIVGFHVRPDAKARELASREKVEIRLYDIIYKAVEEVKQALEGMLKPEIKEVVLGTAEVREVFRLSKSGVVAGCMVTHGAVPRTAKVRLMRDGATVWNGRIGSLRRFKDDVREVTSGFECGIALDGMNDVKVGDVIEAYTVEELARTL
jgi:translation initiation factor IF-2